MSVLAGWLGTSPVSCCGWQLRRNRSFHSPCERFGGGALRIGCQSSSVALEAFSAGLRRRWLACVKGLVAVARSPVFQQLRRPFVCSKNWLATLPVPSKRSQVNRVLGGSLPLSSSFLVFPCRSPGRIRGRLLRVRGRQKSALTRGFVCGADGNRTHDILLAKRLGTVRRGS